MKLKINPSFSSVVMLFKSSVLLLFALFVCEAKAQEKNDPVLMTIAGSTVTKSEFLNIYHKNTAKDAVTDKKSLEEYMELYINFKLKVKEAEEMGLDTAVSFKEELDGYRKQLAQPYLTDKDVNENLLKEAYERLQSDVRASHLLVKCDPNALPKDTLEAYNKIMKIRARIIKGEDFAKVAMEKGVSDDPSVKDNGGDLGFFTAFQMVYPFETAAYNTPVGEVSMPVRTRFGYHILKVMDKRKAQGEVLVAHIMIKTPSGLSKEDSLNAKAKIDEIYQKLINGEAFGDLALQYSHDKASARKGGELTWIGTNRMPLEFEQAAFALQNNGDFSEPVKTRFGWHIIKRLDRKGIAPFEEMKVELKSKISKDSRSEIGREALVSKIKSEYGFKENLKARDAFYKVVDTNYFEGLWSAEKAATLNKELFSLLDKKYTQADFAQYLESRQSRSEKMDIKQLVNNKYIQFVDESCIAFEESRLDQKYPEFRALMQEYRDGILLFELTDKKVWSKAVKDTMGLQEYFEKNKNNYLWDERADASIYTCADEKIASQAKKMINKNKSEKEILAAINKDSQLNLQIESQVFQKKENELLDAYWVPGVSENKTIDKKIEFVVVHKLLKPEPKTLQEVKGLVIADYQGSLEKEWIEFLRKKYVVNIDKQVLSSLQ